MTRPAVPPPPDLSEQTETIAEFWRVRCKDCAHLLHPLSRCSEIVGTSWSSEGAEPDYCPCSAEMPAMEAEIRRLTSLLVKEREPQS